MRSARSPLPSSRCVLLFFLGLFFVGKAWVNKGNDKPYISPLIGGFGCLAFAAFTALTILLVWVRVRGELIARRVAAAEAPALAR